VVAQALRFRQFSWLSPKPNPNHSNATISGLAGDIMFTTPLAANTPTLAQFSATVDGVARAMGGAIFAGGTDLPFTLAAPAVTAGQKVQVSYAPTGAVKLQDAQGNLVAAFTVPVRNALG
jgi:hypothetical protein